MAPGHARRRPAAGAARPRTQDARRYLVELRPVSPSAPLGQARPVARCLAITRTVPCSQNAHRLPWLRLAAAAAVASKAGRRILGQLKSATAPAVATRANVGRTTPDRSAGGSMPSKAHHARRWLAVPELTYNCSKRMSMALSRYQERAKDMHLGHLRD